MVIRIVILKIQNKYVEQIFKTPFTKYYLESTVKGPNPVLQILFGCENFSLKKPRSTCLPEAKKGTGHWCQKPVCGQLFERSDLWKQPPQRKDAVRSNHLYYHLPPRNANRSLASCIITRNNTSKG